MKAILENKSSGINISENRDSEQAKGTHTKMKWKIMQLLNF